MSKKIKVPCPSCGGTGLYKWATPYTRNGEPFCFRCNGEKSILVYPSRTPASGPCTRLAIVMTKDFPMLVHYDNRRHDWSVCTRAMHVETLKRNIKNYRGG